MNNITNFVFTMGFIWAILKALEVLLLIFCIKCAQKKSIKKGTLLLKLCEITGKLAKYTAYTAIALTVTKIVIYYR